MTAPLQKPDAPALDRLSTLRLPTLPAGTPYLLKSLTDENIDFIELAAIVEKFPGIAGKLISLVNSAWSAPASPITSLESTCSRLGFGVVRSTSIALAIATPFNPAKCLCFDPEYYWCSALMTADTASRLVPVSTSGNALEPSTARAAGLLYNLGLLWLVDRLPAEVDRALTMVKQNRAESLRQALLQVLGFDQAQAGGHLARSWELPETLALAITHYPEVGYQGAQDRIVTTVALAANLVAAVMKDESCPEPDDRLARLEIEKESFADIFAQLRGQKDRVRAIAKVLV